MQDDASGIEAPDENPNGILNIKIPNPRKAKRNK